MFFWLLFKSLFLKSISASPHHLRKQETFTQCEVHRTTLVTLRSNHAKSRGFSCLLYTQTLSTLAGSLAWQEEIKAAGAEALTYPLHAGHGEIVWIRFSPVSLPERPPHTRMWKLHRLSPCFKTLSPHCGLQQCSAELLPWGPPTAMSFTAALAQCCATTCGDDRGTHLTAALHRSVSVGTAKHTAPKRSLCIFSSCAWREKAAFHFLPGCQNKVFVWKWNCLMQQNPEKLKKRSTSMFWRFVQIYKSHGQTPCHTQAGQQSAC